MFTYCSQRFAVKRSLICVRLSFAVALLAASANSAWCVPQTLDQVGRWVEPAPAGDGNYCWPYGAMHAIHLSTGQILAFYAPDCPPFVEQPRLYNRATGVNTFVDTGSILLRECQGNVVLEDGSPVYFGGSCGLPEDASAQIVKFSMEGTGTGPWQLAGHMYQARWYPKATLLGDGRVLLVGGTGWGGTTGDHPQPDDCTNTPHYVEIYDPATQTYDVLENATRCEWYALSYPLMFLLPDSTVAWVAGANQLATEVLDITNEGSWEFVDSVGDMAGWVSNRGTAVMFEPGKVLMCGGINGGSCSLLQVAVRNTARIDFTVPNPQWETNFTMDMLSPRRDHQLVVTPGGDVIVVGGTRHPCPLSSGCDDCTPVYAAESINPHDLTPEWTELAWMTIPRGYHSAAILLPDASILIGGGENMSLYDPPGDPCAPNHPSISAERFEPPYLFVGNDYATRPVIGFAPRTIAYESQFRIQLGGAGMAISKVCLIRPAAATHGFDHEQRRVPLTFTPDGPTILEVNAPAHGSIAPPGWYMLFVVSSTGVPSVAAWVNVG